MRGVSEQLRGASNWEERAIEGARVGEFMVDPAALLLAAQFDSMAVWGVCHRGIVRAVKCAEEFCGRRLTRSTD